MGLGPGLNNFTISGKMRKEFQVVLYWINFYNSTKEYYSFSSFLQGVDKSKRLG